MATLERGRRRLARAPSSIARESSAAEILTWPRRAGRSAPFRELAGGCAVSNGLSCVGRPVRMTSMPNAVAAATAPSTIAAGAWSPPMASTAIVMGRARVPGVDSPDTA
jgi:hypothetical protein